MIDSYDNQKHADYQVLSFKFSSPPLFSTAISASVSDEDELFKVHEEA